MPSIDSPLQIKKFLISADTANTKYAIVKECLESVGIKSSNSEEDDCQIFWYDTGVIMETVMGLKPWQMINHFPGMSEICRKDTLARNLNRLRKLFPSQYDFFPKTWWMPGDLMDFQMYAKSHPNEIFIAKPDASSQGKGIQLFKYKEMPLPSNDVIYQKYIPQPLLLDGYKFDFRIYVLVTNCQPLEFYIYKEGLTRLTTSPYQTSDLDNVFAHLTNYAINKSNHAFDPRTSKRTMSSVMSYLKQKNYNTDKLWQDIKDAMIKTLLVVTPYLERIYQSCSSNYQMHSTNNEIPKVNQCFEILGFDILTDSDLKPWILEVNHSPSLTCDTEIDREIKYALLRDTFGVLGWTREEGCLGLLQMKKEILKEIKLGTKKRLFQSKTNSEESIENKEEDKEKEIKKEKKQNQLGMFEQVYPVNETIIEKYKPFLLASHKVMALDQRETKAMKHRTQFMSVQVKKKEEVDRKFQVWQQNAKTKYQDLKKKPLTKSIIIERERKSFGVKLSERKQLLMPSLINLNPFMMSEVDEDYYN